MAKIVVCFFGITRSLGHTAESIEANILSPAKHLGETKVIGHFYNKTNIDNPRSGECGQLNIAEYRILPFDHVDIEDPSPISVRNDLARLKAYGDEWGDDFRSLSNLAHQLRSLAHVGKIAATENADVVLFCRPDLRYHDCFRDEIKAILTEEEDCASIPRWQSWYGYNDRFAICHGQSAIQAYSQRIHLADVFCKKFRRPLNGEALVKFSMKSNGIKVRKMSVRASRVRFDGTVMREDFSDQFFLQPKLYLSRFVRKLRIRNP